jgi:6-phosphogluconate dehydrogenase
MSTREIGIVGLGRMGGGLALQAMEKGIAVYGYDVQGAPDELTRAGLVAVAEPVEFRRLLAAPRAVFLYVPAGPVVDQVIRDVATSLEPGDVIVDGGNSYWGDSIRRHERLKASGIGFVDLGTSGGIDGARHGACFMAGGERIDVEKIEAIVRELAVPDGYVDAGGPGAGHYVKLVHNGIEFGMLQAIAEGVALLESFDEPLPVADVLRCWRHGSVIRSWLVDLMEEQYRAGDGLERIPAYVEDTGEVNWLVADAMRMEVAAPVIAAAVMQLIASRDEHGWARRAIAAMRHGFGGHPFGADQSIRRERQLGRVGDVYRPPMARRTRQR